VYANVHRYAYIHANKYPNPNAASADRDCSADQGSNPEADRASGGVANGIRFADCDSHRVANGGYPDASSQPHERVCRSGR
jgi:hypothetical protein